MRIVNSRTCGFVLVLDQEDIEYGKKAAKDPAYYQNEMLKDHLGLFDSIVDGIDIKVCKYDPHVIPALVSCLIIDDDEERLLKLFDVFDPYMQLVTKDWGYCYLQNYLWASCKLAATRGTIEGYVLSVVEDEDDDWEW